MFGKNKILAVIVCTAGLAACELGGKIEPPAYTVVYNANGGGGEMGSSVHVYGTAKKLNANAFTREGYAFSGWAETPEGAVKYTDGQSVTNMTRTAGAAVTLYAVWNGNAYTVQYNANGGGGNMADSVFTYGVPQALRTNAFTRTGYVFAGWAASASGAVVYTDGHSVTGLTAAAGATVTLYAKWSGNSYTVIYNANGGTGTMANTAFIYGTAQNLRTNAFTRTGYAFTGWAASASGAVAYSDGQSVSGVTTTAGAAVTLYAVWSGISYTVAYNANGGIGSMANTAFTYDVAQNLPPNTFTRTGYAFVGWATSASGAVAYLDGQNVSGMTTTAGATVTLYAVWNGNAYTIVYNANGGGGNMTNSGFLIGMPQNLPLNTYTRTGYTFTGWAASASGAVVYTDGHSVTDLSTTAGATVTLYAVWSGNAYTVAYNANGGIGNMANTAFTYGTAQNLPLNTYTRTGYTFAGWAESASGAVAYLDGQSVSGMTTTAGATVTLYAVWNGISYTVAYNANGGIGNMANTAFTYGTAQNLRTNAFTRTGYTFTGWAKTPEGQIEYTNGQSVTNLTTTAGAAVTLYAVWGGNAYTVAYNVNGGTGTMANTAFTYDVPQNLRTNAFTRTGYTFTGWAKTSEGPAEYTNGQSVSNLTTTAGGTVTLYAVWSGISYTVAYNANGGEGEMEDSGFTYGTAQNLRANAFTRTSYTFTGWAASASGTAVYTDGQSVNNLTATAGGTVTLYAVWQPITIVPGATLAAKLDWLQTNALSNVNYIVEVSANETISSYNLSYSGRSNIGITMKGVGATRTVDLSTTGVMFLVGAGITLVLDSNITLRGQSYNGGPLVRVFSDGTLVMNNGSAVTGNTYSSASLSFGGGGVSVNGTFTMNGGTISGNTASGGGGGGVHVSNGTFTMSGGTISGNTASYSGGGVFVDYNGGTFTKIGGTIYGYSASDTNSNVVKYGSSVQNDRGHAVYAGNPVTIFSKRKETTAGPGVNLSFNGTNGTSSGVWDY